MWNSNLKASYISLTQGFFRRQKSWLEKDSNQKRLFVLSGTYIKSKDSA